MYMSNHESTAVAPFKDHRGAGMKVRVNMTVEIDPEVWAIEYGLDPNDKKAIREDVKNYIINGIHEAPVETVVVR
jgi:hypothetical protein